MIELFNLGLDFSVTFCIYGLVLRTTWVRLRPVLALTGIYFAFLVSSIDYVIAFSEVESLYLLI